jgi:hypothetical protein
MLDQQAYSHTPTYPKNVEMNTQSSDAKVPMQPIKQLASRFSSAHIFLKQQTNVKDGS